MEIEVNGTSNTKGGMDIVFDHEDIKIAELRKKQKSSESDIAKQGHENGGFTAEHSDDLDTKM